MSAETLCGSGGCGYWGVRGCLAISGRRVIWDNLPGVRIEAVLAGIDRAPGYWSTWDVGQVRKRRKSRTKAAENGEESPPGNFTEMPQGIHEKSRTAQ